LEDTVRGGTFEVSWRVENLGSKDLNVEVQRVNKIIFASRPAGAIPEYDVALSYASEDRDYVEKVAAALKERHITVFDYRDEEQAVATWGMDLYQCLSDIYSKLARYTVALISEHYVKKAWTTHEMRSAQASASFAQRPYILPTRFDNTEMPGLSPALVYASLNETSPVQLAEKITKGVESTRMAVRLSSPHVRHQPESHSPRIISISREPRLQFALLQYRANR
jgi:hypothetical protein